MKLLLTLGAIVLAPLALLAQSDPDGSSDLDLGVALSAPADVLLGTPFTATVTVTSAATSEADAHDLGLVLEVEAGIAVSSCSIGAEIWRMTTEDGRTRIAFEGRRALAPGDAESFEISAALDADAVAGSMLGLSAVVYADDGPFERGAPPTTVTGVPFGGVDLAVSGDDFATSASVVDDGPLDMPAFGYAPAAPFAATADIRAVVVLMKHRALVTDGERPVGPNVWPFESRVTLTGNGRADVEGLVATVVLSPERHFLGFTSLPAGVLATATPNLPTAGSTTLYFWDIDVPLDGSVDLFYRSGIPTHRIIDASSSLTTPSGAGPTLGTSVIADGGETPGGGDPSIASARVHSATFETELLDEPLLPEPVVVSVESEFYATHVTLDENLAEIGDTVCINAHFEVAEHIAVEGPATLDVIVPDGMTWVAADADLTGSLLAAGFALDTASTTPSATTGDTRIRFLLPEGVVVPEGADLSVSFEVLVDGTFEGTGENWFESGGILTVRSYTDGVGHAVPQTPAGLGGAVYADDGATTIGTPRTALTTHILRVILPDGTIHDGAQALAGAPYDPVANPVPPGTQLRFASTVVAPGVPVLGGELGVSFPLATGAIENVSGFEAQTSAGLADISAVSVPRLDADGNGAADTVWGANNAPFVPGANGFASLALNNGVDFALGTMPESSSFAVYADVTVTPAPPEALPANGLVRERQVAVFSHVNEAGVFVDTLTAEVEFDIAYPVLTIVRQLRNSAGEPVSEGDAGDLIEQRIVVSSNGLTDAWVDAIRDRLPDELVPNLGGAVLTNASGLVIPLNVTLDGDEILFRPVATPVNERFAIPTGEVWTIAYPATLDASVLPDENLVATASVNWWAAITSVESFGPISASNGLSVDDVSLTHSIIASSADFSSGNVLALGEIADLQVVVGIPESTIPSASIVYTVPTGLEIISATVSSIESPLATPQGAITPVLTYIDVAGGDGLADRIEIELGDVVNPADDDQPEEIVLDVQVRVRNAGGHENGDVLRPRARFYTNDQQLRSRNRSLVVRIPQVDVSLNFADDTVQGGDQTLYTIRAQHAPGSAIAALDVLLDHIAPSELTVTGIGAVRASGNLPAVPVVTGGAVEGDPLLIAVDQLPVGGWIEVDVLATVAAGLPFDHEIDADVTSNWSTLAGSNSAEANYSGAGQGSTPVADPVLTRALENSDVAGTFGDELTVGEGFDVLLTVEIPRGQATELIVEDDLDSGWTFLGTLATTVDPNLVVGNPTPVASVVNGVRRWNFGSVAHVDAPAADQAPRTLTVRYRACLRNVADNQTFAVTSPVARVVWDQNTTPGVAGYHPVILPRLRARGDSPRVAAAAGSLVTYRVRVDAIVPEGFGSAPIAHDSLLRLPLPAGATLDPNATPADLMANVDTTTEPGVLLLPLGDLAPGETRDLNLAFTLDGGFSGEVITFNGEVRWSSVPGTVSPIVAGDDSTGERTGDVSDPGGDVNDLVNRAVAHFDDLSGFFIGFEDLAFSPSSNDFDYNDLVLAVNNQPTITNGNVTQLVAEIELVARGAAFEHRAELRLFFEGPITVAIERRDAAGNVTATENLSFDGSTPMDLTLFASTQLGLPSYPGAYGFAANTSPDQAAAAAVVGESVRLVVNVADPAANPYVEDDPDTPQVHEDIEAIYGFALDVLSNGSKVIASGAGRAATLAVVSETAFPGTPLVGLPMSQARIFGRAAKWPTERTPLWEAYPAFVDYALGTTSEYSWFTQPVPGLTWPVGAPSDDLVWTNELINTSGFGVAKTTDRQLGTPVFTDVNQDGRREIVRVTRDLRLQIDDMFGNAGLDVALGQAGETTLASPRLWDHDGDGRADLVIGTEAGRLLQVDLTTGAITELLDLELPIKSIPAVGDLDGDGDDELVVTTGDGFLRVLGPTPPSGFPIRVSRRRDEGNHVYRLASPVLADLTGNGRLDIVVATLDGQVLAFDARGRSHFRYRADEAVFTATPSVADLEGDGRLEIVALDDSGRVRVLDAMGRDRWAEAYELSFGAGATSPLVVDIDGDGRREIVIAGRQGRVVALDANGAVRPNFPVALGREVIAAPVAADLDGKRGLEIVIANYDGHLAVLGARGLIRTFEPTAVTPTPVVSEPLIVDADRDGELELVVTEGAGVQIIDTGASVRTGALEWNQPRGDAGNRGTR